MELISVVLGGKLYNSRGLNDRFYDTKKLFELTYDHYAVREIAEYGDAVAMIDVGKATKATENLDAIVDSDISTVVPVDTQKENVRSVVSIDPDIKAPVRQDQVLGHISYYVDGLVYTTNITAGHPVKKLPYTRYNIMVIVFLIVTFLLFLFFAKIFKKHQKAVIFVEVIIFIAVCVIVSPYIKKDIKNRETVITPAQNVTLEDRSVTSTQDATSFSVDQK